MTHPTIAFALPLAHVRVSLQIDQVLDDVIGKPTHELQERAGEFIDQAFECCLDYILEIPGIPCPSPCPHPCAGHAHVPRSPSPCWVVLRHCTPQRTSQTSATTGTGTGPSLPLPWATSGVGDLFIKAVDAVEGTARSHIKTFADKALGPLQTLVDSVVSGLMGFVGKHTQTAEEFILEPLRKVTYGLEDALRSRTACVPPTRLPIPGRGCA